MSGSLVEAYGVHEQPHQVSGNGQRKDAGRPDQHQPADTLEPELQLQNAPL